ncbi:MAG TPA: IS982 family transposase [Nitrososphaera sp.]|nr:IS982 family transposase [Nitrososphaera sp.]
MFYEITAIYTIMDDTLKAMRHQEDPRRTFSDAEVLTTALVASRFFSGHLNRARLFLQQTGLMPKMISESRFNRRWHALSNLLLNIFEYLGYCLKQQNQSQQYLLDSFPLEVCDNIRIRRCRLLQGEDYRGYCAAKRRYFYGLRVHVVTTSEGIPVELAFLPGEANDSRGLSVLSLELPQGSEVFMDAGYTDYQAEDDALAAEGLRLSVGRKKNSTRRDQWGEHWYKKMTRHRIETVFSEITSWFPKRIHAVTLEGFLLKATLFVFAFALSKAFI